MLCKFLRTSKRLSSNNYLLLKSSSSQMVRRDKSAKVLPQEQHDQDDDKKEIREFINVSKMEQKIRTKKPQREPFVKNLFLGIFDIDFLAYPEPIEKQDWLALKKKLEPVQNYMETADVTKKLGKIPKDHLEALSRLNLLGLQAPVLFGGEDMTNTEGLCYNEALSYQTSSIGVVDSNYCAINFLTKFGTQEQQAKYLERLTKGQVAAFCINEPNCIDIRLLKTSAKLSTDNKTWILNGTKRLVINGESADIFIVYARTNFNNVNQCDYTAFILERSMGGIITKSTSTSSLDNTDICEVSFKDVQVPIENVLGNVDSGDTLLQKLLPELRLRTAPMCITLTRRALNDFLSHCKEIELDNMKYYETDAVSYNVGQAASTLYAMESVTYLTSSLMDMYTDQDCQIEAAITKVFCSENCYKSATSILEFIGTAAFDKEHWSNKYHRDALGHVLLNETNDNLKLSIALLGLQHAGLKLNEKIRKLRNPLFYPAEKLKRIFTNHRQMEDRPKLTLHLHFDLHPSLKGAADVLEYCVLRLQFATEHLLAMHGSDIIFKHMELKRLGQCAIDIYAAVAVLSRASRSYCIGLRNSDLEITMANVFCSNTRDEVRKNILELLRGQFGTNDQNYRLISKRSFDNNGKYCAEHPLEKNF